MAAEGKSLLPIKTMERVNLRECYHSLLLAVFKKAGLFRAVVELVRGADQYVSVRATILIGELLHLVSQKKRESERVKVRKYVRARGPLNEKLRAWNDRL